MSILFKNKALSYVVRFFRRTIELITRFVLFLKYCGRAKKLADIEDPILLEPACNLAAKIRRGEEMAVEVRWVEGSLAQRLFTSSPEEKVSFQA
ncbi:hypothetical protein AVEN_129778-1 [Araneus ventricosus]|uniref:Uncharacterized protein n=1 Tax=Araneus ventricosus TaxID=182803 RepID=A0A4Y2NUX0_ARAVE|nr:hypothetical protein AVEN_129778-1 [Araneus ventricosus]